MILELEFSSESGTDNETYVSTSENVSGPSQSKIRRKNVSLNL